MKRSTDRILEILQDCPAGLTAKEVADRLGASPSNIGSRLSKLAAYGIIKKVRGRIISDAFPCAVYFAASHQMLNQTEATAVSKTESPVQLALSEPRNSASGHPGRGAD